MSLEQTVDITQIALFVDPVRSGLLGRAVWSALDDVATFFTAAGADDELVIPIPDAETLTEAKVRTDFKRQLVVAEGVDPPARPDHVIADDFLADLHERQLRQRSQSYGNTGPGDSADHSSTAATSRSAGSISGQTQGPRRIDARLLGSAIQTLVQPSGWSLIVTDLELTPPADWRYIIWDSFPQGAVASIAPLDPEYWREPVESEKHRVLIAKNRTRAACMSIVGALAGMQRCDNDECFLYFNVDSVVRLDVMRFIGPEHGVRQLSNRGFGPTDDPLAPGAIASMTESAR